VAYSQPEEEGMQKVYLYSLDQGKSFDASGGWYTASSPEFSGDGKYLFFVSDRDFNPLFSKTEWNHAYQDMSRIYLVTLSKETRSPFEPKSDEVGDGPKVEPGKAKGDPSKGPPALKVDTEGLKDRVLQLPVQPAFYGNLQSVGNTLYYLRT